MLALGWGAVSYERGHPVRGEKPEFRVCGAVHAGLPRSKGTAPQLGPVWGRIPGSNPNPGLERYTVLCQRSDHNTGDLKAGDFILVY